jgi:hypothetical protein
MSNVSVTVHLGPLELAKHSSQKFGQIEREFSSCKCMQISLGAKD